MYETYANQSSLKQHKCVDQSLVTENKNEFLSRFTFIVYSLVIYSYPFYLLKKKDDARKKGGILRYQTIKLAPFCLCRQIPTL